MSNILTTLLEALKRGIWFGDQFIPGVNLTLKYLEGEYVLIYTSGAPFSYTFKVSTYGEEWSLTKR